MKAIIFNWHVMHQLQECAGNLKLPNKIAISGAAERITRFLHDATWTKTSPKLQTMLITAKQNDANNNNIPCQWAVE
jgi:hypothetical protein